MRLLCFTRPAPCVTATTDGKINKYNNAINERVADNNA